MRGDQFQFLESSFFCNLHDVLAVDPVWHKGYGSCVPVLVCCGANAEDRTIKMLKNVKNKTNIFLENLQKICILVHIAN